MSCEFSYFQTALTQVQVSTTASIEESTARYEETQSSPARFL